MCRSSCCSAASSAATASPGAAGASPPSLFQRGRACEMRRAASDCREPRAWAAASTSSPSLRRGKLPHHQANTMPLTRSQRNPVASRPLCASFESNLRWRVIQYMQHTAQQHGLTWQHLLPGPKSVPAPPAPPPRRQPSAGGAPLRPPAAAAARRRSGAGRCAARLPCRAAAPHPPPPPPVCLGHTAARLVTWPCAVLPVIHHQHSDGNAASCRRQRC